MSQLKALVKFPKQQECKLHYSDKQVRKIIEMWGVWSSNSTGCGWYNEAPGMRNVLPIEPDDRDSLCDEDALVIDKMIASMYSPDNERPMGFFIMHYVYGINKSQVAKQAKCSEKTVRAALLLMEQFFAGMLNQRYSVGFRLVLDAG
ncbi:antiterminator Q family protein [Vibrio algivorus]|uniref:Antitermination protein Q n=1 Tax=Vibrio algivorus TaxID=1667024 RepID=A0ABQ6EM91_9VIBR|nr:antiterminator Q family protein [Vibrio algivorus]GLT13876.1 antitermination protein Q [Vibrio algivorus]